MTNLTKLIQVDLSYNQFSSRIGEFQSCNSLPVLILRKNRLSGSIPKSISNLLNLKKLDISSNNLSGIVEFDKATKLKELWLLDLAYNSLLLKIKSELNNTFPALSNLDLASCSITEFPNFLISSKKLEWLDLSNNRIYNNILKWMFEIGENLSCLNPSRNFLSSIERHPWTNLWYLNLVPIYYKESFPFHNLQWKSYISQKIISLAISDLWFVT